MNDLDEQVRILNNMTRVDATDKNDFFIECAYDKPRLYRQYKEGRQEISPRLTKSELRLWIEAFLDGIMIGKNIVNSR
jgi:hypothetical protein